MKFRILGPLEVLADGAPLYVVAGKQRALLADLLLNPNRAIPVTKLVDDLWGDRAPESAVKAVQVNISRLRKVLPAGRLRTHGPGYVLEVGDDELDLAEFTRLGEAGRQALAGGNPETAADLLSQALSLWRGPALAEIDEPFAEIEAPRLEELRLGCLEDRFDAELELGRHAEIVGELDAEVGRHPHRERLRAQQMLALYRSGRHAEGLESYRSFRRMLADELGIDPPQRLRSLERRILTQDPELDGGAVNRGRVVPPETSQMPAFVGPGSNRTALLVARDGELDRLRQLLEEARGGRRGIAFVSGRPGIGKTTLVRSFVHEAVEEGAVLVAHGQCFEQYGQGEAYMPVLEALGRLCRGSEGDRVVRLLADRAPSWLAQLPGLAELPGVDARSYAVGAAREPMLRELVEAVEAIAEICPFVLLLEDLHWSDPSTVDVLAAIARRGDPARLLVLATYRPQDARATAHPIWETAQELEQRGLAAELRLHTLELRSVADYLLLRFPGSTFPADLVELLYGRTDGNPLFLEKAVDSWLESGSIAERDGIFSLGTSVAELSSVVPATLRQLLERQLGELGADDRELVDAASVAGTEFVAAAVASACERPDEEVELRLTELARQGWFVVLGEALWPDGTVSTRLRFVHDLYAEISYAQLPPGRRTRLHRSLAARLESAFGRHAGEIAGELAHHLVRGREPAKAITYLNTAAQHALARGGHREAIEQLAAALETLGDLADSRERAERELSLRITLGNALLAERGYAAPETTETYARARELCTELGENAPAFLPVLYGLWGGEAIAGRHRSARELVDAFVKLAEDRDDDAVVVAHRALAWSLIVDGDLEAARDHLGEALRRFDPHRHGALVALYGEDPAVAANATLSLPLMLLGFPDQAAKASSAAVARAQALNHPLSLAYAHFNDAVVHQLRLEHGAAADAAEAARAVAGEFGIMLWGAWAETLAGWAASAVGAKDEGLALISAGIAGARATGAVAFLPHTLSLAAEADALAGDPESGLATLGDALALCEQNDERYYEAEIHRLRGELLLALEPPDAVGAEQALQRAVELARAQGARLLELRAAVSLGRLWRDTRRGDQAREILEPLYGWFTEGLDTTDLRNAAALLAELGDAHDLSPEIAPQPPL